MRLKAEAILDFGPDDGQNQNKIIREYRREYKVIGEILDGHPEILDMAHRDLEHLSKATSRRGRKAGFTSENLFRAIIVMQREGFEYRETSVRIAESETLQNFCRLRSKRTIDFTPVEQGIRCIAARDLGDDEPHPRLEGFVGRNHLDRSSADRHHGHRMQHPLADRLGFALGHISRDCQGNVACQGIRSAVLPVAFSREEGQEHGLFHLAIFQEHEQEAAPQGPPDDENADRTR